MVEPACSSKRELAFAEQVFVDAQAGQLLEIRFSRQLVDVDQTISRVILITAAGDVQIDDLAAYIIADCF